MHTITLIVYHIGSNCVENGEIGLLIKHIIFDTIITKRTGGEHMTLAKIIAMCDEIRPNQYDKVQKTLWINEIEHKVIDEVYGMIENNTEVFSPYDYELDEEKTLLIPDEYSDVYLSYLYSKMDFSNAEIDRYNIDASMFTAAWKDYASWMRRNNRTRRLGVDAALYNERY